MHAVPRYELFELLYCFIDALCNDPAYFLKVTCSESIFNALYEISNSRFNGDFFEPDARTCAAASATSAASVGPFVREDIELIELCQLTP